MFSCALELDKKAIQVIDGYHSPPEIIYNGNRALYLPNIDTVTLPIMTQDGVFYRLLFHELIHSTGATYRLNRKYFFPQQRSADEWDVLSNYEEMVAHQGSWLLLRHCDMLNTASFIDLWIEYYQNRISALEAKMAYDEAVNAFEFIVGSR